MNNLKLRGTPGEIYWSGPDISPELEDRRTGGNVPEAWGHSETGEIWRA